MKIINPSYTILRPCALDAVARKDALHAIAGECGEIHGIYQKVDQEHPLDEMALIYEVGDLLWGIAELCTAKGWSMDVVAERNIRKLRKRYPVGFDAERSVHREES